MGSQEKLRPAAAPLIAHGLEFIDRSVDLLGQEPATEREGRHAIVLLAIGIELILKSRLLVEHWSLLFEKIDDADVKDFNSGDFKSARPDQCLERLVSICQVALSDRTKTTLKSLAEYRNRVVHFAAPIPVEALRVRAFAALSELVDFVAAECMLTPEDQAIRIGIETKLLSLKDYISKRRNILSRDLHNLLDGGYFCPVCDQRAIDAREGRCHCIFCNEDHFHGDVQDLHLRRVLQHDKPDMSDVGKDAASCGTCESWHSIVRIESIAEKMRCLGCGLEVPQALLRYCSSCSHWTAPDSSKGARCADCGESI